MNGESSGQIADLVELLNSSDAAVRQASREKLVELGGDTVTRTLVTALIDPRTQVRREAGRALQTIADPIAAPALLNALDDEDKEVRWIAGEALIALEDVGLKTVLSGLIRRAGSPEFCKSAHHVLHARKQWTQVIDPVLHALNQHEPAVMVPPAAYKALVAVSEFPPRDSAT